MPLIKIKEINKHRYMGVWHIASSFQELIAELSPSPADRALVDSFGHEQKKLEWASGRLAVKALCEKLNIPYCGLRKDEHHKPYVINSDAEISLTHSYPYVAAIIDKTDPVGIDLEQPKEKLLKIAGRFLNDDEKIHAGGDLQKLCLYWCAKEALYKLNGEKGVIFKSDIALLPFDFQKKGIVIGNIIANGNIKRHKLAYSIEKDYVLTYNC